MKVTKHRVTYADTDSGGVMYYANHFKLFEIGRTELIREKGVIYKDLESKNIIVPVVEAHCNYSNPASYDDQLTLETKITSIGGSSIRFEYKLLKEKTVIATGHTVNVFVDMKTGKSVKISDEVREKLT